MRAFQQAETLFVPAGEMSGHGETHNVLGSEWSLAIGRKQPCIRGSPRVLA
jgi:hypothetical protein